MFFFYMERNLLRTIVTGHGKRGTDAVVAQAFFKHFLSISQCRWYIIATYIPAFCAR